MAYTATLVNRHEQFGRVSYDLRVTDNGPLPDYRSSVSWPIAQDTAMNAAILAGAVAIATDFLRDREIATNIQSAINQGSVTFLYSTPAENIAAVRAVFRSLSGWQAVCLGNYINSLGLTNAQYTNFFGYSGAALTAFKARLAAAAQRYADVIATSGE